MFRRFLLHSWKHSTREYITTECYPVTWSSFNQTPEKIWSGTSIECLHARFGSARASECLCWDLSLGNLLYHNFNFHGYHQNKWTTFCRITKHYHWLGWSSNILNPLTPVPAVTGHAKTHPQFPVPAVTGHEKPCQDNCLSYPPVMESMVFRNKFSRCRYIHQLLKLFIHSTYILCNLYSFVA